MTNYWKINEDGKSELYFDYATFKALPETDKKEIKAYYLWSRGKSAWISKSKDKWRTEQISKRIGLEFEGKEKPLTFEEELAKKESRAENRIERYDIKASKAEKRAESLQSEFNRLRKDWSWLTQPIINGHAGSQAFGRSKARVVANYTKGFEEHNKASYYESKKQLAEDVIKKPELKNIKFVQNRIADAEKSIRAIEKWVGEYTDKVESWKDDESKAESISTYEGYIEEGLAKLKYNYDKLAYYKLAYDDIIKSNEGGEIKVFDKSLSIELSKYIKKFFKEVHKLTVSTSTSQSYIAVGHRPSMPNDVRKSIALMVYPERESDINSWDSVSIGNIMEVWITLYPIEWYKWLKTQGWDFGKKDTIEEIAKTYDIPESEVKEAEKIETEHIDTLEKVYEHKLTPEQGVEKIVSDHLSESSEYYDPKIGLPAMEKELESTIEINSKEILPSVLVELCYKADIEEKTIVAEVEDSDVEYYNSLGFKIKE